ncbi:hypothetical protein ILYODFUR_004407 [Ilyodon furcidens]|uniref:Uncharacterized protein n=1 Tax=Ilyodon furcidens TaxID=33524 RepID=A0ABV0UGB1_9TELE
MNGWMDGQTDGQLEVFTEQILPCNQTKTKHMRGPNKDEARASSKTWNQNRNIYCRLQLKALHAAEHDADEPSDDTCYSTLYQHHHQRFLVLDSRGSE